MRVWLVDGTYELFRHFFGAPPHTNRAGQEVAAVRGVVSSVLGLMEDSAGLMEDSAGAGTGGSAPAGADTGTGADAGVGAGAGAGPASAGVYVGVATDHIIESFRNDMWPGYKTGEGVDPALLSQFGLLEDALGALGVAVWPMVELEADDALASAAAVAAADPSVDQVVICTPDKDLGQCVEGGRIVQMDRRKRLVLDEPAVRAKFGVGPASIPDYLGLVGDSADGFPGLPGWGAKSTAAVLARYEHLEDIPDAPGQWDVPGLRGAGALAVTLAAQRELALLFRDIATLRRDPPVIASPAELRWKGPADGFAALCRDVLGSPGLVARAERLAQRLG